MDPNTWETIPSHLKRKKILSKTSKMQSINEDQNRAHDGSAKYIFKTKDT